MLRNATHGTAEGQVTQICADIIKEGGHSCPPRREAGPPRRELGPPFPSIWRSGKPFLRFPRIPTRFRDKRPPALQGGDQALKPLATDS